MPSVLGGPSVREIPGEEPRGSSSTETSDPIDQPKGGGVVNLATVTDDAPLTVQVKGDTTATVAQQKASTLPAVSVGDTVLVAFIDKRLLVLHKIVTA